MSTLNVSCAACSSARGGLSAAARTRGSAAAAGGACAGSAGAAGESPPDSAASCLRAFGGRGAVPTAAACSSFRGRSQKFWDVRVSPASAPGPFLKSVVGLKPCPPQVWLPFLEKGGLEGAEVREPARQPAPPLGTGTGGRGHRLARIPAAQPGPRCQ